MKPLHHPLRWWVNRLAALIAAVSFGPLLVLLILIKNLLCSYLLFIRRQGKQFSSDDSGDGPGIDDALLEISFGDFPPRPTEKGSMTPGQNHPRRKNGSYETRQGRNKKVDFQKPKSGGRNNKPDHVERSPGKDQSKREHRLPQVLREEERAKKVVLPDETLLVLPFAEDLAVEFARNYVGYDGFQVYSFDKVEEKWVGVGFLDGKLLNTVPQGRIVDKVVSSGIGYVVVFIGDDPSRSFKKCVAKAATRDEQIDFAFVVNGVEWEQQEYEIFLPLLHYLQTRVRTPEVCDSLKRSIMAAANSAYPLLVDHDIVASTVSYYIHYNNYRIAKQLGILKRVQTIELDRLVQAEMARLGEVVNNNRLVVVHNSMDCPVRETYSCRTDCNLVFRYATHNQLFNSSNPALFDQNDQRSYPRFLTSVNGARSERYKRSTYLGFYPQNAAPFVMYSVNALNACKALKRMCANRESAEYERSLSNLQYTAFAHLFLSQDVQTVLNDNDKRVGPNGEDLGSFRAAFLKAGRIKIMDENVDQPFSSFLVGSKRILEVKYPEFVWKNTKYVNPFVLSQPGIFIDYPPRLIDNTNVTKWMFDNLNLDRLYKSFRVGFNILLGRFSFNTLDEYLLSKPTWAYGRNYQLLQTTLSNYQSRFELGLIPHVKRYLRSLFVSQEVVHDQDNIMTNKVEAKVKKEFAKQGKVPRLYVTYGAGCMYANELPEYAKICLDNIYEFKSGGVTFNFHIFAKPSAEKLNVALNNCIDAMSRPNYLYVLIYSDDSVWSGNLNGISFAYNVDISSCDSGNKGGVFGLIFMLLSQFSPELALGLVTQCNKPIKLVNPENPDELCEVHMGSFFEGSGTTLTTILNHVAMYMICMAAVEVFSSNLLRINSFGDISVLIQKAGEAFGHVLSVELCQDSAGLVVPEKIQFLKRSPLRTTCGKYIAVMNYGCIFRGFGSVEGDLTPDMLGLSSVEFTQLLQEKDGYDSITNLFLSGVVAGLVHEPSSIVMAALRRRFAKLPGKGFPGGWVQSSLYNTHRSGIVLEDGYTPQQFEFVLDELSICRRYDLNPSQLIALAWKIENSRFSFLYPDEAVGAFACTDYGCVYM